MSTNLSLHHVGEAVLAGLLRGLADHGRVDPVRCKLHANCSLPDLAAHENLAAPLAFKANVPLVSVRVDVREIAFDGAHGVDVLCHGAGRGLAMEAKLGLGRMSSRAFNERFLRNRPEISNHKPPRFNGSMTAILNFRGVNGSQPLTLATGEPPTTLVAPWILVVRARTWSAWETDSPPLMNAHVVVFEDVAKAYGDGEAFDRLVHEQIGGGFHAAWKVFE